MTIIDYIIRSVFCGLIGALGLKARAFLLHRDMDKETMLFIFIMLFLISFSACVARGY